MSLLRNYIPSLDFSPPKVVTEHTEDKKPTSVSTDEIDRLVGLAVKEASAKAFLEGERAGREAAENSIAASGAVEITTLGRQLTEFFGKEEQILRETEEKAVRLVLSVVQKVAVRLSELEMESLSRDISRRAIETARGSSKIVFRVSTTKALDSFFDSISGQIEAGRVSIEKEHSLPPQSLCVEWDNGAVSFDPYTLEKSVTDIIQRTCSKLPNAEIFTNEPMETANE